MEAAGKTAFVYPAAQGSRPVIYLHSHTSDAQPLLCAMRNCACGDCTLVVLQGVSWNRELTPSPCPPIVRGGEPFGGGAKTYLQQLTEVIIPAVEKALAAPVVKRGIVGYSLAGLFAVYALFYSDCFSFGGSVSGSLWYPGFVESLCTCPPAHLPQSVYFSLGRQEGLRTAAVGSRSMVTHSIINADFTIECFIRSLANMGVMVALND